MSETVDNSIDESDGYDWCGTPEQMDGQEINRDFGLIDWSIIRHDSRLTHEAVQNRIETHCDLFNNGVGIFIDSERLVVSKFKFEGGKLKMNTVQLSDDGDHAQAVKEVQSVKNSISGI